MKCTEGQLRETRSKLSSLVAGIAGSNQTFDIIQQLDALEWLFAEFDKCGQFVKEEQPQRRGGWNADSGKKAEEEKDAQELLFARVKIAVAGLSLLQQAIPTIKQISDRCLEVAGPDAVRRAC